MSLKRETGGVRVSAHVPDESSNKQNQLVRLGMNMDAVAAVWENIAIIPDEITKAANGQISFDRHHALQLQAAAGSDGFYKQQTQPLGLTDAR